MTDEDQQFLKNLIDVNGGECCRITFADGQEFELTLGSWWQDMGEKPHAHATVSKVISSPRNWTTGSAMSFCVNEIERIADPVSGQIVFQSHS